MPKIRRLAQQAFKRVPGRQCTQRALQIANVCIRGTNTDSSAEILQHINAGPSVRRVHHQVHGSVWFKYVAQSLEACVRVGEMVKNPGAHNLIEAHSQVAYSLKGEAVDLEIFQVVFLFKLLGAEHTRGATVDAGNFRRWPAQCMLSCLRCSAASNENGLVFAIRLTGPE